MHGYAGLLYIYAEALGLDGRKTIKWTKIADGRRKRIDLACSDAEAFARHRLCFGVKCRVDNGGQYARRIGVC